METLPSYNKLLTDNALYCAAVELGVDSSDLRVTPVSGGFSRNRRALVSAGDRTIFVKEVDVDVLPDDGERELAWLKKDYEVMRMLQEIHPQYVADQITLSDDGHVLMTTSYVSRRLVVAAANGKICGRTIYFSSGNSNSRAGTNRAAARGD